jgi:hypothetical protein
MSALPQKRAIGHQAANLALRGTQRTYRDVCYSAAFGDKVDISQRLPNNRHADARPRRQGRFNLIAERHSGRLLTQVNIFA